MSRIGFFSGPYSASVLATVMRFRIHWNNGTQLPPSLATSELRTLAICLSTVCETSLRWSPGMRDLCMAPRFSTRSPTGAFSSSKSWDKSCMVGSLARRILLAKFTAQGAKDTTLLRLSHTAAKCGDVTTYVLACPIPMVNIGRLHSLLAKPWSVGLLFRNNLDSRDARDPGVVPSSVAE